MYKNFRKLGGNMVRNVSKDIEVNKAENGYFIKVVYYEKLDCINDFVKVPKIWVAESKEKKDEILKII
jgi:hypothetical protein